MLSSLILLLVVTSVVEPAIGPDKCHQERRCETNDIVTNLANQVLRIDRNIATICKTNKNVVINELFLRNIYILTLKLPQFDSNTSQIKTRGRSIYINASRYYKFIYIKILPYIVDIESITWKFNDGILTVLMPFKVSLQAKTAVNCQRKTHRKIKNVPNESNYKKKVRRKRGLLSDLGGVLRKAVSRVTGKKAKKQALEKYKQEYDNNASTRVGANVIPIVNAQGDNGATGIIAKKPVSEANDSTKTTTKAPLVSEQDASDRATNDADTTANGLGNKATAETGVNATALSNTQGNDATTRTSVKDTATAATQENNATAEKGVNSIPRTRTGTDKEKKPGLLTNLGGVLGNTVSGATGIIAKKPVHETNESTKTTNNAPILNEKDAGDRAAHNADITANEQGNKITAETHVNAQGNNAMQQKTAKDDASEAARENYATSGKGVNSIPQNKAGTDKKKQSGLLSGVGVLGNTVSAATGIIVKKPATESDNNIKTTTKAPEISEKDASERAADDANTTKNESGNKRTAETGVNATALPNAQGKDATTRTSIKDSATAAAQENNANKEKDVNSIPRIRTGTDKKKKPGLLTGLGGVLGNTVYGATGIITKKPVPETNDSTKTTNNAPVLNEKDASDRAVDDADTTVNEPGNKTSAETNVNANVLPNAQENNSIKQKTAKDNATEAARENYATLGKGVNSIPQNKAGADKKKKPGLLTGLGGVLGTTVSGATGIIAKKPATESNNNTKTTTMATVISEKDASERAADDANTTANEPGNKATAETGVHATVLPNAQGNDATTRTSVEDTANAAAQENNSTTEKGVNSIPYTRTATDREKKPGLLTNLGGVLGNTVSGATGIIVKKPATESNKNTKTTDKAPVISEQGASERAADNANTTAKEPSNKGTAGTGVNATALPNAQGNDATTRTIIKDTAAAAAQENNATTEKDINPIPRTRSGTNKEKKPGLLTGLAEVLGNTVSGATGIINKKPHTESKNNTKTTTKAPVISEKDASERAADDANTALNEPGNKETAETGVNATALPNAQINDAIKQKTANDDTTAAAQENNATSRKGFKSIPKAKTGTVKEKEAGLLTGLRGVLGSTVSETNGILAKKPALEKHGSPKTKKTETSEKNVMEKVSFNETATENELGNKTTTEKSPNATVIPNIQGNHETTRKKAIDNVTATAEENNANTEKSVNFIPKTKAGTDKEKKPGLLTGLGGVLGNTVSGANGIIAKKPTTESNNNTKTISKAPVISEKDASERAADDANTTANKPGNKATAETGVNATALPNAQGNDATTRTSIKDTATAAAEENNATTEKDINSIPRTRSGTDKKKKPGLLAGFGEVLGNTVSGATGIIAKKPPTESKNNTKTTTKAPVISEKFASERTADNVNIAANEPGNKATAETGVNVTALPNAQVNDAIKQKTAIPKPQAGTDKENKPGLLTGLGGILGNTISGATGIIAKKPPTESNNNTKTTTKAPLISEKDANERASDDVNTTSNKQDNKATAETGVNATAILNVKSNYATTLTTRKSDIDNVTATAHENNATTEKSVKFNPKTKAGTDEEKKPGLLTGLGGVFGKTVLGATGIIAKKPYTKSNNNTKTTTKAPVISDKDASERAADDANTTANEPGNKATAETGVNATALPNAKSNNTIKQKIINDTATAAAKENNATLGKGVNFSPQNKAGTDKKKKPGLLTGLGGFLGKTVSGATGISAKKQVPEKHYSIKTENTKIQVTSEKNERPKAGVNATVYAGGLGQKKTAEKGINGITNAQGNNVTTRKSVNDTATAAAQENKATAETGVNATAFLEAQGDDVTTQKTVNDTATATAQENIATLGKGINSIPLNKAGTDKKKKPGLLTGLGSILENTVSGATGISTKKPAPEKHDSIKTNTKAQETSEKTESTKDGFNAPASADKSGNKETAEKGMNIITNGQGNNATTRKTVNDTATAAAPKNKATAETGVNATAFSEAQGNDVITQKTVNDTATAAKQENDSISEKVVGSIPQNETGKNKKKKPGLLTGLGGIRGNTVSGATGIRSKKPAPEKHDTIKTNTKVQVTSEKKQSTKDGFNATASAYKPGNKGTAEKGMNGMTNAKGNSATTRKSVNDTATAAAPKIKATAETGVKATAFSEAQGNDVITKKTVNDTATAAAQDNDATSGKDVNSIPQNEAGKDKKNKPGLLTGLGGILRNTVSGANRINAKKSAPEKHDSIKNNTKAKVTSEKKQSTKDGFNATASAYKPGDKETAKKGMNGIANAESNKATTRKSGNDTATAAAQANKATAGTIVNATAFPEAQGDDVTTQKTVNDTATAAAQENIATSGKGVKNIYKAKSSTENEKTTGLLTGLGGVLGKTVSRATGIIAKKPVPETNDSTKTTTKAPVLSDNDASDRAAENAVTTDSGTGNKVTTETNMNVTALPNAQGNNAIKQKTIKDTQTAGAQENNATSGKGVNSIPQNKAGIDKKKKLRLLTGLGGVLENTVSGVAGISAKKTAPEKYDGIKTNTKAQVTSKKNKRPKAVFNATASAGGPGNNETAVKGMNGIANAQRNNATIRKSVNDTATAATQENKATAVTGANATVFPEAQDNDVATQKIDNETATVATQGNNATSGKGMKTIPNAKAGTDKEKTTGLLTGLGGILGKTVSEATGIIAKKPVPETNDSTKTAIKAPVLSAKDISDRAAENANTNNNGIGNKATAAKNMNATALPNAKNSNAIKQKTINDTATAATQEKNATSGKGVNFIPRNKAGPDKKKKPGLLTGLGGILGNTISGATGINANKPAPEKHDSIKTNTKKQVTNTKNERANTGVNATASLDGLGNKETAEKGMNVVANAQGNNTTSRKTVNDTATAAAQENKATAKKGVDATAFPEAQDNDVTTEKTANDTAPAAVQENNATSGKDVKTIPKAKSGTDKKKKTGLLTGLGGVLGNTVSVVTGISAKKPTSEKNDTTKTNTKAKVTSEKSASAIAGVKTPTSENEPSNKATAETDVNGISKTQANNATTRKSVNDSATATAQENKATAKTRVNATAFPKARGNVATQRKTVNDTATAATQENNATSGKVVNTIPNAKAGMDKKNKPGLLTGLGGVLGKTASGAFGIIAKKPAAETNDSTKAKAPVLSEKDASERAADDANTTANGSDNKATSETGENATAIPKAQGNDAIIQKTVNDPATVSAQENNANSGKEAKSIPEAKAGTDKIKKPGQFIATEIIAKKSVSKIQENTKTTTGAPFTSERKTGASPTPIVDAPSENSTSRASIIESAALIEPGNKVTSRVGVSDSVPANEQTAFKNKNITKTTKGASITSENNVSARTGSDSTVIGDAPGKNATAIENVNANDTANKHSNKATTTVISEKDASERLGKKATAETDVNATAVRNAHGHNSITGKSFNDPASAASQKNNATLGNVVNSIPETPSPKTNDSTKTTTKAPVLSEKDAFERSATRADGTANELINKATAETGVNSTVAPNAQENNAITGASVAQEDNATSGKVVNAITEKPDPKRKNSTKTTIKAPDTEGDDVTTRTNVNDTDTTSTQENSANSVKDINFIAKAKTGKGKKKKPGLPTGLGGVLGNTFSPIATGIVAKKPLPKTKENTKTTTGAPLTGEKNTSEETGSDSFVIADARGENETARENFNANTTAQEPGDNATTKAGVNDTATANAQSINATARTSVDATVTESAGEKNLPVKHDGNVISNAKPASTKDKKLGLLRSLGRAADDAEVVTIAPIAIGNKGARVNVPTETEKYDDAKTTTIAPVAKENKKAGINATNLTNVRDKNATEGASVNSAAPANAKNNNLTANTISQSKFGATKKNKPGLLTGLGGVLGKTISGVTRINAKTPTPEKYDDAKATASAPGTKENKKADTNALNSTNVKGKNATAGASINLQRNNLNAKPGVIATAIKYASGNKATARSGANSTTTANAHGENATTETSVNSSAIPAARGNNATSDKVVSTISKYKVGATKKKKPGLLTGLGGVLEKTVSGVTGIVAKKPAPEKHDGVKATASAPIAKEDKKEGVNATNFINVKGENATVGASVNSAAAANAQSNNLTAKAGDNSTAITDASGNKATARSGANSTTTVNAHDDNATPETSVNASAIPAARGNNATTEVVNTISKNKVDTTKKKKPGLLTGLGGILGKTVSGVTGIVAKKSAPERHDNTVATVRAPAAGENNTSSSSNATVETSVNATAIPAAQGSNATADKVVDTISKDKVGDTKKKKPGLLTGLGGVLGKTISGVTGIVAKKPAHEKHNNTVATIRSPGASENNASSSSNATAGTSVNATAIPAAQGSNATADKVVDTISKDKVGDNKKKKPGLLKGLGGVLGKTISGVTGIVAKKPAHEKHNNTVATIRSPGASENNTSSSSNATAETSVNATVISAARGSNATADKVVDTISKDKVGDTKKKKPGLLTGLGGVLGKTISGVTGIVAKKPAHEKHNNTVATIRSPGASENNASSSSNATAGTSVNATAIPAAQGSNATADKVVDTISKDKVGDNKKKKPGLLTGLGGVLGKTISGVTGIIAKKPAPERHNNTVATIRSPGASGNNASASSNATAETSVNATAKEAAPDKNATIEQGGNSPLKVKTGATKLKNLGLLTVLGRLIEKTVSGTTRIIAKTPTPEKHNNSETNTRTPAKKNTKPKKWIRSKYLLRLLDTGEFVLESVVNIGSAFTKMLLGPRGRAKAYERARKMKNEQMKLNGERKPL